MLGTIREQQAKLLEAGYKPTGFTAMDGRFEVIRRPAGAYGSKVTWNVWDYGADGCGDWVQIYGIKTLQQAKARLAEYAETRLKGEVIEEVHYANHDHYAAWPDTAGVWYTPAECKAAGWKLTTFTDDESGEPYKMWVMPNGKIANLSDHPEPKGKI